VLYDREHTKIGFWKTNCSELWERLHVSDAPPPVSPKSEGTNLTEAFEPSVAPSPSPSQYNLELGIMSCCFLFYFKRYAERPCSSLDNMLFIDKRFHCFSLFVYFSEISAIFLWFIAHWWLICFHQLKCAGELQIAQIIIVISFNVSYMEMKPHITELTGLIANELDVNTSQVRRWSLKWRKFGWILASLIIVNSFHAV